MDKIKIFNRIKNLYDNNANIIEYLKQFNDENVNNIEDIMISYDFQAGSYISIYNKDPDIFNKYGYFLAKAIDMLEGYSSIVEVGIGEGTTLVPLLNNLKLQPDDILGFDISWSRLKYANDFISRSSTQEVFLFLGDLFCLPLKDNSVDIVYTSHSIEPNGGREKEALTELYRITNKYLILLEPAYEFADERAKQRMVKHGYIKELYETAKSLDYSIIEHRLFDLSMNPLNPTGLIIIEKKPKSIIDNKLCCPVTKAEMSMQRGSYYSKESMLAYPVIDGIPCLTPQNAVVATKYL